MDKRSTSSIFSLLSNSSAPMSTITVHAPPADTHDYWKKDSTSVSAVSFGFVATAALIFLFLIVAIFERFLGPPSAERQFGSNTNEGRSDHGTAFRFFPFLKGHPSENPCIEKCEDLGISVLMPGQNVPTFIANPAPIPCERERPVCDGGNLGPVTFSNARSMHLGNPLHKAANTDDDTTSV